MIHATWLCFQNVPKFTALEKWANQWVGATAMWAAQGKIKKKYNIDNEREALFKALEDWTNALGDKPYCGGKVPNLGDLAVYGCIKAIEGLDTHKDILQHTKVGPWYQRVQEAVGPSSCISN